MVRSCRQYMFLNESYLKVIWCCTEHTVELNVFLKVLLYLTFDSNANDYSPPHPATERAPGPVYRVFYPEK